MVKIIAIFISSLLVLRQLYWWQVKEYRFDRWWSWIKYNGGLKEMLKLDWRRPIFTSRVLVAILVWLLIIIFFDWQVIILAGWVAPMIGLFLTWPIHEIGKYYLMQRASAKIKKYQPIVIGITGSYGKSGSKDYLAEVLSQKYNVLKTLANQNTEISIAKRIISGLIDKTQILILEIGAYRLGEIARVCKMAPLDIAWITAIGNQHVDLFGSLDKLKEAKMELIAGLKPKGKAFYNDAAETIAKSLGVTTFPKRPSDINIVTTPGGIKIIDKSYSTNESAFERDIKYLKTLSGRKFVISPGIIELGKLTKEVHERLAKSMVGLDGVWITSNWARKYFDSKDFFKDLKLSDVLLVEGRIPSDLKNKLFAL